MSGGLILTEVLEASENETIASIAHSQMLFSKHETLFTEVFGSEENYLNHFGVKGMKWGVRKAEETGPGRQKSSGLSPRNQKAITAAFAVGLTVGAAVLAKKGANVTVWDSRSTKILLSGAKASTSILGRTGSVLVRSGAKTVKVGSKVGFKTTKVAGRLGGRLAISGTKAAGRAMATNGQNFYNDFLKPSANMTARLGSHISYKLTGRGTPIVAEVVKSKASFNPIDILLNTRSDKTLFKNRGGRV